ncbi:hypothetical protein GIB67_031661 [Kingdonia uniflora]|uniref:SWIM-type domain-containing protein n=1 Tax=Kingdonia uniflora TaxID=39325 RepID=A0A7J7NKC7_9MAGN|nr:hypothetical protein GIB67_031661 [Kingdonia uniflora]
MNPNLSLDKRNLQPEQVKDLVDFQFKSFAYTEDPYDFSKEFNIGDLYRDRIKLKNHIKAYVVLNKFNLEHVLSNEYKIVMRGSFEHTCQLLTSYFVEVRLVDPDFVFDIQTTSCKDKRFTRYRGTLLTAIAIDPSNHIFLLAFLIADSETTESWTYFLELFGSNFSVMTLDSSSSPTETPKLLMLYPKVFSFAIHMFCAFHISNNIKTTLESTRIAFRMVVEALTNIDFDKHMNVIRNIDPVGLQYILGIPKETWFNLYIPMNREEAEKSQTCLVPWATDHCERRKFVADSLTCRVRTSRHHYQMTSYGRTDYVNIEDGTCSCRWWQTMGIPCEHGVRALGLANVDLTTRVSEYFTNYAYKTVYEPIWIPIRGIE